MRTFILGIIAAFLLLGLGGLVIAQFGLMPTNADSVPPFLERRVATHALDAALQRRAPRLINPVPSSDENLIEGMKIYTMKPSRTFVLSACTATRSGSSSRPTVAYILCSPQRYSVHRNALVAPHAERSRHLEGYELPYAR
jgi:hypothetical protein